MHSSATVPSQSLSSLPRIRWGRLGYGRFSPLVDRSSCHSAAFRKRRSCLGTTLFKTSAVKAGSSFMRTWASPGQSLGLTYASVAAPDVLRPLLSGPPRPSLTSCGGGRRPGIKTVLSFILLSLLSLRFLKRGTSYCRSERRRDALLR